MKRFKFIVGLLFSICMTGMVSATVLADNDVLDSKETQVTYIDENGTTVTETTVMLTYEEAVALLMEKKNISREEAENALLPDEDVLSTQSTKAVSYASRYTTYEWGPYEIEIGGFWLVYNEGSFREFESFKEAWTAASGSGSYTWDEYYVTDVTVSYPSTAVYLSARGSLVVAVSSTSGSSLGAVLLGNSFSKDYSEGTTTYYRRTEDLSFEWNLYAES